MILKGRIEKYKCLKRLSTDRTLALKRSSPPTYHRDTNPGGTRPVVYTPTPRRTMR
jgi:hypothetical protein